MFGFGKKKKRFVHVEITDNETGKVTYDLNNEVDPKTLFKRVKGGNELFHICTLCEPPFCNNPKTCTCKCHQRNKKN